MSEPNPYVRKIDRRTALAWIGVVCAATAVAAPTAPTQISAVRRSILET